ncbi:MAG: hypothetical protein ACRDTA_07865 [Pseudonocardiaceae bacterium]
MVLALGPGEGAIWELIEAMRILPPERLVLLVPIREQEYKKFCHEARQRLQVLADPPPLSEYTPDSRIRSSNMSSRLKALIYYSSDLGSSKWKPAFV